MSRPRLLIVAHQPSPNTRALAEAVLTGTGSADGVESALIEPLAALPEQVLAADAIILGTTENLGYMSGALKDFFDRIYYPVLEEKQGLPCALYIRAGLDGTGTRRAVRSIVSGLRWRWVAEPLVLKGEWRDGFVDQARELGATVAAGLELGVF